MNNESEQSKFKIPEGIEPKDFVRQKVAEMEPETTSEAKSYFVYVWDEVRKANSTLFPQEGVV